MKNVSLVCLFITLGISCKIHSQEIIATGGDYFSTINGSMSVTIGEPATETFTGTVNILTQGFQQSRLKVLAIDENYPASVLVITVYPNPVKEFVKIKVENATNEHFSYNLFDAGGKLMLEGQFEAPETEIPFYQEQPAVYILKIRADQKEIKGFKIIKQ
jgi:hypothetical protein